MFEWMLVAVGVVGFSLGAYWDLKTTEFPDWLPYIMITLALAIRGGYGIVYNDFTYLTNSVIIGVVFLGFGLALYYAKQWGDGDAWLLGALGFLFPDTAGFAVATIFPFPVVMIFNFFFIAFVYLLAYSVALGLKSRKESGRFFRELKGDLRNMVLLIAGFSAVCAIMFAFFYYAYSIPMHVLGYLVTLPVIFALLIFFLRYGRFVEANLFKRKIPVSELREGDVLVSDKWRGLTKKEIKKMQERGGHVWIKEGVRFAPVFVITMVITLSYGSLIMLFV